MRPDQHFDAPGKSPFMDMQLVPKYAEERTRGEATVHVSRADGAEPRYAHGTGRARRTRGSHRGQRSHRSGRAQPAQSRRARGRLGRGAERARRRRPGEAGPDAGRGLQPVLRRRAARIPAGARIRPIHAARCRARQAPRAGIRRRRRRPPRTRSTHDTSRRRALADARLRDAAFDARRRRRSYRTCPCSSSLGTIRSGYW